MNSRHLFVLIAVSLAVSSASAAPLPHIHIAERGELHLDAMGEGYFKPWTMDKLRAPTQVGLLMLLPARPSARRQIAALEQALEHRQPDYRRLSSTSIVNLADGVWGAGWLVESSVMESKRKTPLVRLVVDEHGVAQRAFSTPLGQAATYLYDCAGQIIQQHIGAMEERQALQFMAAIDSALAGSSCTQDAR